MASQREKKIIKIIVLKCENDGGKKYVIYMCGIWNERTCRAAKVNTALRPLSQIDVCIMWCEYIRRGSINYNHPMDFRPTVCFESVASGKSEDFSKMTLNGADHLPETWKHWWIFSVKLNPTGDTPSKCAWQLLLSDEKHFPFFSKVGGPNVD